MCAPLSRTASRAFGCGGLNKYVYNPGNAPFIWKNRKFAPKGYSVVSPEEVSELKAMSAELIFEGDEGFVAPFKRYPTGGFTP